MDETAHGGPFPEILDHTLFLNCIFARPGSPVFVPHAALGGPRRLTVIGDVACDPDGPYNPVPVYDRITNWIAPASTRIAASAASPCFWTTPSTRRLVEVPMSVSIPPMMVK